MKNRILLLGLLISLNSYAQSPINKSMDAGNGSAKISTILPVNDPSLDANWDWTTDNLYNLYTEQGLIPGVALPFFSTSGQAAELNSPPRDIRKEDGWVLLRRDFGTATRAAVPAHFILYNKYRGIFRVFYYTPNAQSLPSYNQVRLSFLSSTPKTGLFTFADGEALNTYNQSKVLTVTSKSGVGWSYADFYLVGYDPLTTESIKTDATLMIEIIPTTTSNVNLTGSVTLDGFLGEQSIQSSGSTTDPVTMAFQSVGASAVSQIRSFKDTNMVRSIVNKVMTQTSSNTWVYNALSSVASFGISSVAGIAANLFQSFIGGGASNPSATPMHLAGDLTLTGTITTATPRYTLILRVPGSPHTDPSGSLELPLYDKPLGIFNFAQYPVVQFYKWMESYTWADDYFHEYSRTVCSETDLAMKEFPIVINPYIGIKVDIKTAFILPNNPPDGYTTGGSDGYMADPNRMIYDRTDMSFSPAPIGVIPDDYEWATAISRTLSVRLMITPESNVSGFVPVTIVRSFNPSYQEVDEPLESPILPTTIASNMSISGNSLVVNDVTINSGVTLTILPGSTIRVSPGKKITSYGRINAVGTSASKITFMSNSGSNQGTWGSLILSGPNASNSVLDNVNFLFGTEIDVINASNVTIQNSLIQYTINGIYYSGSTGLISNNSILTPRDHGILVQNSGTNVICNQNKIVKTNKSGAGILYSGGSLGNIWQNDVYGFNWGICCSWGSSLQFMNAANIGKNNRVRNCLYGVYAYQYGYPTIAPSNGNIGYYAGNDIYGNSPYDVINCSSAYTLSARQTYWGAPSVNTSKLVAVAGSAIDYADLLISDPWYNVGPSQTLAKMGTFENSSHSINDGVALRSTQGNTEAKKYFMEYVSKHPNDQEAYVQLYACYNETTSKDLIDYFTALPKQADKAHQLLLSYMLLNEGNVEKAIENNTRIAEENPNTELSNRAVLNNFYIALHVERNFRKAHLLLAGLKKNRDLSTAIEIQIAEHELELHGGPMMEHVEGNLDSPVIPEKMELRQNFPNPFNPSTTIAFDISQPTHVSLIVYDCLGREVATLVNAQLPAGRYQKDFSGANLGSGVYFYRINTGQYSEIKKMLLLK